MDYITVRQAAAQWGISERRIQKLCQDNRIKGQMRFGRDWMIPANAEKPADARIHNIAPVKSQSVGGKHDE